MSKKNLVSAVAGIGALALGATYLNGQTATISTYTEQPVWVNNSDVHRVWVKVDNRPLGGESTDGMSIRVTKPTSIDSVDFGKPDSSRDFYHGDSMFYESLLPIGSTSGRSPTSSVYGNNFGDAIFYDVRLNSAGLTGTFPKSINFNVNTGYSELLGPGGNQQPWTRVNGSVTVTYGGDTNVDGKVDITDLATLATNWQTNAWTNDLARRSRNQS